MALQKNIEFATLFTKLKLRSQLGTLAQISDLMAKEGVIVEESTLSKWKNGTRTPQSRVAVMELIKIFTKNGGISSLDEANTVFVTLGMNELQKEEVRIIEEVLNKNSNFLVPKLQDYILEREGYLKDISWNLMRGRIVCVSGMSGSGKTVLAIQIAHILRTYFEGGVIFISGRNKEIDEIVEDIYRVSLSQLKVSNKRFLIIVDDVSQSLELIKKIHNRSKLMHFLITTTTACEADNVVNIYLKSFTTEDATKLACYLLGKPYVFSNSKELTKLYESLGYSPLGIVIALKNIKKIPEKYHNFIEKEEHKRLDIKNAKYDNKTLFQSLEMVYQNLLPDLQKLLLSLGSFSGNNFLLEVVGYINNISIKDVQNKVKELENLSLVEKYSNNKYRVHPLVKMFIHIEMTSIEMNENLIDYYKKKLLEKDKEFISEEIENIAGLYEFCFKRKKYDDVIIFWELLSYSLWELGYWRLQKKICVLYLKACTELRLENKKVICYIRDISWCTFWLGDIKKAKEYALQGLQIARKEKNDFYTHFAYLRLGKIFQRERQYKSALKYFMQSLTYFSSIKDEEKIGIANQYVGETYVLLGDINLAKIFLEIALKIFESSDNERKKAVIYNKLGVLDLLDNDYKNAEKKFKKSIFLEKLANRKVGGIFWNNVGLGLIYESNGLKEKARNTFEIATQEMHFLGIERKDMKRAFSLTFLKNHF